MKVKSNVTIEANPCQHHDHSGDSPYQWEKNKIYNAEAVQPGIWAVSTNWTPDQSTVDMSGKGIAHINDEAFNRDFEIIA